MSAQTTAAEQPLGSGTSLADDVAAIARIDAVEKILEVICRTTGLGFSAVARVTDARWIACAVRDEISFGLKPGGELKVETTLCSEIRQSGKLVVIDHVAEDPAFCKHHTPLTYGFQSYISVPILRPGGEFFGTLCALDPRPARLKTPEVINMFKLFADLIGMHLQGQERIAQTEAALLNERSTSQLREQFIAVLGHDLRNPLGAINAGTQLLRMAPHDPGTAETLAMIQRSADRMRDLITDVMDFARSRLGGGLTMDHARRTDLGPVLTHVIAELQSAWPKRVIVSELAVGRPISCDSSRVAQLLSNLLGNAISHGDPAAPIKVQAKTHPDQFELSVTNRGQALPEQIRNRIFEPFVRGISTERQGLGLGLYIASEIARAHKGSLDVHSADNEIRFTFRMPLAN